MNRVNRPMRPMLRPGLSWGWRSAGTLQFGIDDPSPVIVSGLAPHGAAVISLMDGVRTRDEVLTTVQTLGPDIDVDAADTVIERLLEVGAVVDGGTWPGGPGVPAAARARLLPDLLAVAPVEPDRWWQALATAHVTLVGASRLGATIASALASAGIGRVTVDDGRPITASDVTAGGFTSADLGKPRSSLLARHPELIAWDAPTSPAKHLSVVTDAVDMDTHSHSLAAEGVDHLAVSCWERTGRVGPFVRPGATPCLFCIQLSRRDADAGWAQLWRQRSWSASPVAHSSVLSVTAHTAVAHIISWVVGDVPPSTTGVVEISAPHCTSTFRPSQQHPECGCGWATMAG